GKDGVDGVGHAGQVAVDLGGDVLGAEVEGRGLLADAGAGDEHVGGAEAGFQLGGGGAGGGEVGDVGGGGGEGPRLQLLLQGGEALGVAVEGGDSGALGGQDLGQPAADSA